MLLLMMIPFLNVFLKHISARGLSGFIIIIFAIRYLAGSLFAKTFMNVGNTLEEFVVMYFLGALLSKGGGAYIQTKKFVWILWAGIMGIILSDSALYFVLDRFPSLGTKIQVTHFHDLFEIAIAVGAFGIAMNKTFHSRTINMLAGCTLGTYLIHDNPMLREIIWRNDMIAQLLNSGRSANIAILFFYAIFVMAACFVTDGIIRLVLQKPVQKGSLMLEKAIVKTFGKFPGLSGTGLI